MYSILIKDSKNAGLYRFLTVKQEIIKEESKEVRSKAGKAGKAGKEGKAIFF